MYPGGGRLSRSQPRKSVHPYNKKQATSQAFRRTLDGIPGKVAITSGSPNSTEKIIAWLAMSPNDDKDNGKGDPSAPYVLNASDTNRTEFYMQNVPPSWSPGPIPQGPDQPAPVRLAIDGTSYCATFDPNPQSAQPLTVKNCFAGPDEGMPHQSQIFMYDGKTGEVKPVWASQDQGSDSSSASAAGNPSFSSSPSTPSASGGSLSARQDPPPPPPPGATPPSAPTDASPPPANPSGPGDAPAPPPGGPAPPALPGGGPAPPAPPAGVPALPISPPSPPGPPAPPAPPTAMSADDGSSSDPASPEPTQTVTLLFVRDDKKGPGAALQKNSDSVQSAAMASGPNFSSSGVSSSTGAVPTPSGQAFAAEETATVTRTITVYGTPSPSPTGMNAQGDNGLPSSSSLGAQGVPTSSVDPSGSGISAQGVPTSAGPSGSGIGAQAASTSLYADPSSSNVGAQGVPTSSTDPSASGVVAQGVPTSSVDPSGSSVVGAQDAPTFSPVDSSASTSTSPVQPLSSIGAQSAPPYPGTSVIGSSMAEAAYTSPAESQSLSPSASPSSAGLNAMSDSPQGTGNSGASGPIVTASSASGPNVEMFGTSTSPSSQYGSHTAAPSSSSDASAIAASIAASMRPTASGGSAEAAAAENTSG
ncbi:hypothetical protein BJ165DRAFT_404287 [Panaeolus papilionaceus]|nr:hypothetical protein BJ165DRAFT_404287 [Panaeolus papilionaceus]